MTLLNMTDDGYLTYSCPGVKCSEPAQTHHVTHDEIRYTDEKHNMVTLPRCACGTQTSISAAFSEEDLAPPIITYNSNGSIAGVTPVGQAGFMQVIAHNEKRMVTFLDDDDQEVQEVQICKVIDQVIHPIAWVTHQQNLVKQMERYGKTEQPIVQGNVVTTPEQG